MQRPFYSDSMQCSNTFPYNAHGHLGQECIQELADNASIKHVHTTRAHLLTLVYLSMVRNTLASLFIRL
jgi:hypothetical protein